MKALLNHHEREALPTARRLAVTFAAVAALHVVMLALLADSLRTNHNPVVFGLLITAYLAGVKHSYDWDHIAAIDNSTRRFAAQGRSPVSVGFAFSMGHSMVVVLAGVLVVSGAGIIQDALSEGSSANMVLSITGASVSGLFLLTIGIYNAAAFRRTALLYRRVQDGAAVTREELAPTGLVARLLDKPLSRVNRPRDIFVLGFLFGLGFDTASTIAFLLLSATAALAGISPLALLALPFGFMAAMTLCDTVNGVAMMKMYGSAVVDPKRRIGFNMVITGVSAASALFISVITIAGVLHGMLGLTDPVTTFLAELDLGHAGLVLVALLLFIWAAHTWLRRAGEATSATTRGNPQG